MFWSAALVALLAALAVSDSMARASTLQAPLYTPYPYGLSPVEYFAAPGESNRVTALRDPQDDGVLLLVDPGAQITAVPPCAAVGSVATCSTSGAVPVPREGRRVGLTDFDVHLGDGDDQVSIISAQSSQDGYVHDPKGYNWLIGDSGNDTIHGGIDQDHLQGEDGNDILVPGPGFDAVSGGEGNDRIDARDGPLFTDNIWSCGGGEDVVYADAKDFVADDCEQVIRP